MSHSGSLPGWKEFVRGSCKEVEVEVEGSVCTGSTGALKGNDARQAYEEIVQTAFTSRQRRSDARRKVASTECGELDSTAPLAPKLRHQSASASVSVKPKPPVSLSSLMRYVESSAYDKVEDAINSDASLVNAVDQFGWSPLMVAACAGAIEIVELLLLSGANVGVRDKGGQSCISLARKKGHLNVIQLIRNFSPEKPALQPEPLKNEKVANSELNFEFCDDCNVIIEESRKKKHLTSTIHQLSRCSKGCKTFYSIPGNNRGYQLMLKNGWDGEKGLGPSGSGMKLPPKTVLKRDRKGLGASKGQARITHFQSNDTKAVARNPSQGEHSSSHQNKSQLKRQIRKEKLLEAALRRELS
ncbi:G patch domain and ankyrin repeat-containing protein 1 homolog [Thrips palmi]|uniref:G patch domain and ankyrin repeat-containing protein 1 homolog n=1 Tax=Thrips palmi TaxID=161013 RepID=A0A6P8ZQ05_THRPL|nr:G patch domain and ankyrin repeat-containing protein 1 homolog [Thrips palmi]